MSSIKLGSSMKLGQTINMKKPSLVENPELSFTRTKNTWNFSLNGLSEEMQESIQKGHQVMIQLVLKRPYKKKRSLVKIKNEEQVQVGEITYEKITFPSFVAVRDPGSDFISKEKKARLNITKFRRKAFKKMNITKWINNMIKWNGIVSKNSSFSRPHFMYNMAFCILINNKRYALTDFIKVEMYNKGNININYNYKIENNTIKIRSKK